MALPTIEVLFSTATPGFLEDKTIFKQTGDILEKADGHIKTYYGLEHEDGANFVAIMAWESLQKHTNFINNTEVYKKLGEAITLVIKRENINMYHVAVKSDPSKAFGAPVLEVATFTLKDGQSKSALEGFVDKLAKAVNAAPESAGATCATWGPVVEKNNLLNLFIGWTSVDAHWTLVKADTNIVGIIGSITEIADIAVIHAPLTLYSE